jgi:hypothetical protein
MRMHTSHTEATYLRLAAAIDDIRRSPSPESSRSLYDASKLAMRDLNPVVGTFLSGTGFLHDSIRITYTLGITASIIEVLDHREPLRPTQYTLRLHSNGLEYAIQEYDVAMRPLREKH